MSLPYPYSCLSDFTPRIAPGRPVGHNGGMKNRRQIIFEIETTARLEEKLQYTRENPVRAGLVQRPTDWKWGSAR